jgi:superfamily II DNA helicase RecQ
MQESIIKVIMVGKNLIVVVMGMDGEKSLLFMLSIFCGKEGVSVVVMPLIAL